MNRLFVIYMACLMVINPLLLQASAQAQSAGIVPGGTAGAGTPLFGGVEMQTQNGATVLRQVHRQVRHVRHHSKGASSGSSHTKMIRRYYVVKPNSNKIVRRPAITAASSLAGDSEERIELPADVAPLIIRGVQNLVPGKRYVEVVNAPNGNFLIKQSGEIDPNGQFLEVEKRGDKWYIKGTEYVVDFNKTFDVAQVPQTISRYLNPQTDSIAPGGNYAEFSESKASASTVAERN